MTVTEIKDVLGKLVDIQTNSAPIELSIGYVTENSMVRGECIVLKDAPPVVVGKLIEYGYSLDITRNGVIVNKF